ncbi:MAG: dicarboxylate/amino acid:cation symporter [Caulobacteraceae bacterium]|nr:MAG: dicarboxylate/amino acid:cation symporter [Caulobacteraceae bacterium]
MLKSLAVRVLIALVMGLLIGAALQLWAPQGVQDGMTIVEALGTLWLNALRMTIVPLVFTLLVLGIASVADAAATGRLAARSILLFAIFLAAFATYSVLMTQGWLALWPIDEAAGAALRASAQAPDAAAAKASTIADFLKGLAPSNVLKAAVEDAILPLVVFGVFFGFAASRLPDDLKTALLTVFRAIAETMLTVVRWVLWAAPVGVFALSLSVGLRTGIASAATLLQYVVIVSTITASITLIMFVVVALSRAAKFGEFLRASGPVLAVAFSTQSSLASLPLMIERTRDNLGVPDRITGLVLPLAVAVFRATSPVANLAAALFVAHLYGVQPGLPQIFAAVLVSFAVAVGSVGLPGQISFFASVAPICIALGAPIDLLPILLAVEVVPDIFRTLGNVSADMGVTTMLAKGEREVEVEAPVEP